MQLVMRYIVIFCLLVFLSACQGSGSSGGGGSNGDTPGDEDPGGGGGTTETPLTDAESVTAAKEALCFDDFKGDNVIAQYIVSNLNLIQEGQHGTTINWESNDHSSISNSGQVIRPADTAGNINVVLTATITKNTEEDKKEFQLTVINQFTDQEAVSLDKTSLDFNDIKNQNLDSNYITTDLSLVQKGERGSDITWTTTNTDVVSESGDVERPDAGNGDEPLFLTATIKRGAASATKDWLLRVVQQPLGPTESVAEDVKNISFAQIKKGNLSPLYVTSDLSMISEGPNETTLSWSSDKPSVISNAGLVNRPLPNEQDQTVTLTLQVSKEGISDVKSFDVIVAKQVEYAEFATGPGGNLKTGIYQYGSNGRGQLPVTQNEEDCSFEFADRPGAVKTINGKEAAGYLFPFHFTCGSNTHAITNGGFSPLNDVHYFGFVVDSLFQDKLGTSPLPFTIKLLTHYGTNLANAFWTGTYAKFGDGNTNYYPYTSLDIVSHEIAHGFTEFNSGLIYTSQSGGINESFSDIAGEAAEYYLNGTNDFLVAAEIIKPSGKYGKRGFLRSMSDPPADGKSIDHISRFYEGMDVHYSSGIFNKAFYYLANSKGWNTGKAFKVFAVANRDYWGPSTGFEDGASDVVDAAEDLGYNTDSVIFAFTKVGVTWTKWKSVAALGEATDNETLNWQTSEGSEWFNQSSTSVNGGDAAQSPPIGDSQSSHIRASVVGPKKVSFYWKVSSEYYTDTLRFYIGGKEADAIAGDVNWHQKTFYIPDGTTDIRWTYQKNQSGTAGKDAAWLDQVEIVDLDFTDIKDALDNDTLNWESGGDVVWRTQAYDTNGFGSTAESGDIGNDQSTYIKTEITGPKAVRFNWKISSERNYDYLNLYLDGILLNRISGKTEWLSDYFEMGSGIHEIKFAYEKDEYMGGDLDTAWVDHVEFFQTHSSFGDALENNNLIWGTAGDAPFAAQDIVFNNDNDAMQTGAIGDGQSTKLTTQIFGGGKIAFDWKVSSEADKDTFIFYINGTQKASISGEQDWNQVVFDVTSDTNTLTWIYFKNAAGHAGDDAGWIDNVQFNPAWFKGPQMNMPRYYHASTAFGRYIYVFGGGDSRSTVERYNVDTKKWETLRDMHFDDTTDNFAVTINNKIFVITENSDQFYKYHPASDSWSEIDYQTGTEHCRFSGTPVALDGKIYFMDCGTSFDSANNSFEYEPLNDIWRELPAANITKRVGSAKAVHGSKIYVIGGFPNKTKVEAFDTSDETWEELADLPFEASVYSLAFTLGDTIYLISVDGTAIYDVGSNTWSSGTKIPRTIGRFRGAMLDNKFYIPGGFLTERDLLIYEPE